MKKGGIERMVRIAGVAIGVLAGLGAVLVDGDVQITLMMVAAVTAGLLCFDTAMERRLRSFAPWALLSIAPILKTVPTVWAELRQDSGLLIERYDHVGSLLFGACMFVAIVVLARPADRLGSSTATFDAAVIVGASIAGGLAGASVAFLFDAGFGSAAFARTLETPTWFVLSGLLAAAAIAASHARTLTFALTGVLSSACVTAALLALSVAGRRIEAGWWALLFAALAASAAAADGALGERSQRDRRSNVAVVVALIVGLVAATSAIAARSDRTLWSPGWALLGIVSLAMFALAMASKPLDEQSVARSEEDDDSTDARASRARARALQALQSETPTDAVVASEQPVEDFADQLGARRKNAAGSRGPSSADNDIAPAPAAEPVPIEPASAPPEPATPTSEPATAPTGRTPPAEFKPSPAESAPLVPASVPMGMAPAPDAAVDQSPPTPAPKPTPTAERPADVPESPSPLSDAGLVASAQAAATVRDAPPAQRHSLAPLAQAHHFDPSTGLLSSAGLQHAIASAFEVPRRAGHVTMLMFMIRDLDAIEQDHGRLASAAVTREVAERIGSLLPQGTGARFARSAYAVVFVGDMSNVNETTQWLARVLLQLRAPVEGGSLGDKIDVVAGMAQCHESEDAAQFVKRANLGLSRAVQLAEPTLVAMP